MQSAKGRVTKEFKSVKRMPLSFCVCGLVGGGGGVVVVGGKQPVHGL